MGDLLVPCFCSDGRPAAWQDFFRFPLIPVVPAFLLFPALVPDLLGVIPFGSVAIFAALPALFFAFPEAVQVDKVMQRQDGSFSLQDAAKEEPFSRTGGSGTMLTGCDSGVPGGYTSGSQYGTWILPEDTALSGNRTLSVSADLRVSRILSVYGDLPDHQLALPRDPLRFLLKTMDPEQQRAAPCCALPAPLTDRSAPHGSHGLSVPSLPFALCPSVHSLLFDFFPFVLLLLSGRSLHFVPSISFLPFHSFHASLPAPDHRS